MVSKKHLVSGTCCSAVSSTVLAFKPLKQTQASIFFAVAKIIIAIYVDDILVLSPDKVASTEVYNTLHKYFKIENLGTPKTFLVINIVRNLSAYNLN